jgi:hypothetical protein
MTWDLMGLERGPVYGIVHIERRLRPLLRTKVAKATRPPLAPNENPA